MAYTHKEILAATIAEIIRRLQFLKGSVTDYAKGKRSELERLVSFIDSMPVAEASCIWHDARKSVPEDGTNQILCIKEDNLAVVTVNRVVNGTTKWAYVNDLLQIEEIFQKIPLISQEKPASEELEKEIVRYIGYPQEIDEDVSTTMIRKAARHFANWQREQMMKDAVEVEVKDGTPDKPYQSPVLEIQKMMRMKGVCNVGDKVKLIIIKED